MYCLTMSSCSRSAVVHVEEDHALRLEVGLELVVHDLGLVLRADAGEVLLLRLRDAELVPGVENLGRQVLPGVGLLLGRLDVVVDVLEVDPGEIGAPVRHGTREEVVERLVPELPHPVGLLLVLGDRLDDLVRDASPGLEEVVLRVVGVREAVLVVGADSANDVGLVRATHEGLFRCRWNRTPRSPRPRACGRARGRLRPRCARRRRRARSPE